MLQQARTKRLHWWLMETRVVRLCGSEWKAISKGEIRDNMCLTFQICGCGRWVMNLSCIEIRSLSSPPNPFLKPKYVKRRRKISKPEQAFLQSYFHWFFTEVLDQLTNADLFLHGTMPLILINYHPLLLTGLSLLFIPVGRSGPLNVSLSVSNSQERNDSQLSVSFKAPAERDDFGTSILRLPSRSRSPPRSSRDQIRSGHLSVHRIVNNH